MVSSPARRGEGSLRVLVKVVFFERPESRQPFVIVAGSDSHIKDDLMKSPALLAGELRESSMSFMLRVSRGVKLSA